MKTIESSPVKLKPEVWANRLAELYGSPRDAYYTLLLEDWPSMSETQTRYRKAVMAHLRRLHEAV